MLSNLFLMFIAFMTILTLLSMNGIGYFSAVIGLANIAFCALCGLVSTIFSLGGFILILPKEAQKGLDAFLIALMIMFIIFSNIAVWTKFLVFLMKYTYDPYNRAEDIEYHYEALETISENKKVYEEEEPILYICEDEEYE